VAKSSYFNSFSEISIKFNKHPPRVEAEAKEELRKSKDSSKSPRKLEKSLER